MEDANIKISSVVSKVFGVSFLAMICVLLEKDELFADEIAKMSRGKLKKKVDQLVEALNGNVAAAIPLLDTYRAMLRIPDREPPAARPTRDVWRARMGDAVYACPRDSPHTMPVAIRCATRSGSGMWLWVVEICTILAASSVKIPAH